MKPSTLRCLGRAAARSGVAAATVISILFARSGIACDQPPAPLLSTALRGETKAYIDAAFRDLDISDPEALYEAQQTLMLPTAAIFRTGERDLQSLLLRHAYQIVKTLPKLGDLRVAALNGTIRLSPILANQARSGSSERLVFPLQVFESYRFIRRFAPSLGRTIVRDSPLHHFQFSYALSHLTRLTSCEATRRELNATDRSAYDEILRFLITDVVIPYWNTVEAWHFDRPFPNYKTLILEKLNWRSTPWHNAPSYYHAIYDHDLFILAIGSDVAAAVNLSGWPPNIPKLTINEARKILEEIRAVARRILDERLSNKSDFLFDHGAWHDHPDWAFIGCSTDILPELPCRKKDVAWDTSHSHRWPWWLQSFRSSWAPGTPAYQYYNGLLKRLAHQVATQAIDSDSLGRVRMRNFMDGQNGWFRVRHERRSWGYGPWALSRTALYGSWAILSAYNLDLHKAQQSLCSMVMSEDSAEVAFRTTYYGMDQTAPFRYGTRDTLGPASQAATICRLASAAGYL